MTGHYEKGIWIEDSPQPRQVESMVVRIKVEVDDTQARAFLVLLKEMLPIMDRIGQFVEVPAS